RVEQFVAASLHHPGVEMAGVEPERNRRAERENRILGHEIVAGRLAHLDRALGCGIENLRPRDELVGAGRNEVDPEIPVRGCQYAAANSSAAPNSVSSE